MKLTNGQKIVILMSLLNLVIFGLLIFHYGPLMNKYQDMKEELSRQDIRLIQLESDLESDYNQIMSLSKLELLKEIEEEIKSEMPVLIEVPVDFNN